MSSRPLLAWRRFDLFPAAVSGQQTALTLPMPKESFGLRKAAFNTSAAGERSLGWIPLVGFLRDVCIAGRTLAGFDVGDVDEIPRRKHHRVVGDLVEIEGRLLASSEPRIKHKH